MIIQSDKGNVVLALFCWLLCILSAVLILRLGVILPAVLLFCVTTGLLASYSITIGRTIIMDAAGCTIALGSYARKYTWEDISVRRAEPSHLGLRLQYHKGGAFFSVSASQKPLWLDPTLYCTFFHPFSCFYVYFTDDAQATPGIYAVDRNVFINQLDTWGIKL